MKDQPSDNPLATKHRTERYSNLILTMILLY